MSRFNEYNYSDSRLTMKVSTKEQEYILELHNENIEYCFDGILFSPPTYIINEETDTMEKLLYNMSLLYPQEYMKKIRESDIRNIAFADILEVTVTEEIGEESEILPYLEDEYDLDGYAVFNGRKIIAHYHAADRKWQVQKYFLPKYYKDNDEWMENEDCDWRRMDAESDNGCKAYHYSRFWTLCSEPEEGSVPVNEDPKGNRWLAKKWYPERIYNQILKEYEPEGAESGYVVGRMSFRKNGDVLDFDDCYYSDESYVHEDDFVVDESGQLVGFLVEENIVLWIADFEKGGRCDGTNGEYGDFGLILQEYTELDFDENEIQLAEFGYLTHSRW